MAKQLLNRPEVSQQRSLSLWRGRCPANATHLGSAGRIQRRQAQGLCSTKMHSFRLGPQKSGLDHTEPLCPPPPSPAPPPVLGGMRVSRSTRAATA